METHNGAIPFPKLKSDDYLLYSSYRGKELGLQLKSCSDALFDLSVVISLGFTGNFSQWKISDPLPKYSHWYLEDKKNDVKVVFSCKRKLSRITLGEFNEKRSVGIDNQFWVESLRRNCFYKLPSIKKPIYEFLMDQKYANGMGNYMRAEILGRIGENPFMSAEEYITKFWSELHTTTQIVIKESYENFGFQGWDWRNPLLSKEDQPIYQEKFQHWLKFYTKQSHIKDNQKRTFWYDKKWEKFAPHQA